MDLQNAVDAAYMSVHLLRTPPTAMNLGVPFHLAPESQEASTSLLNSTTVASYGDPRWNYNTPTQYPLATSSHQWQLVASNPLAPGPQLLSPLANDPDHLVELQWDDEATAPPTIHYMTAEDLVPPTMAPPQPQELHTPVRAIPQPSSTFIPDLVAEWRPTLLTTGMEPDWVVSRNIILQNLLEAATPLFVGHHDVGKDFCQVCIDHFSNVKLDT